MFFAGFILFFFLLLWFFCFFLFDHWKKEKSRYQTFKRCTCLCVQRWSRSLLSYSSKFKQKQSTNFLNLLPFFLIYSHIKIVTHLISIHSLNIIHSCFWTRFKKIMEKTEIDTNCCIVLLWTIGTRLYGYTLFIRWISETSSTTYWWWRNYKR